jgi:hypothetical protein
VFLKTIELRQKVLEARMNAVPDAVQFAQDNRAVEGKTIGVKLPMDMRRRLDDIQKRHGLASVKQAVLLVLHFGLQQLEGMKQ